MAERDCDKRLDVVRKLLAQATSVAGTPEAEAFTDRAFRLVAISGVERSGEDADAIERHVFPVEGDFLNQRIMLVTRIAAALHCAYACRYANRAASAVEVEVYGARRHIDRLRVLSEPLLTRMFRQAIESNWSPSSGLSLEDHRVSWMQGFTLSIRARLRNAEAAAAVEADRRDGGNGHQRRHVTDFERAEAEKRRRLPTVRRRDYSPQIGHDALVEGYRAGQDADP